jgi:hypothetical protein
VILLVGVGVVLLSAKKELLVERFATSVNPLEMGTSLNQRFLIWSCAGEMFIKHPVLGQGWGLFELYYPFYQGAYLTDPAVAPLKTHGNHAHNEILQVAAELGIFGLLLGFYFLRVVFKRTNSFFQAGTGNGDQLLALGLLAGLLGMMIDSLFNVSLHITSTALFFWAGLGLLLGLSKATDPENDLRFSSWSSRLTWGVTLIVFLMVIAYNTLKMVSALEYFQGMRLVSLSQAANLDTGQKTTYLDQGVNGLERAFTTFPFNVDTAYELANGYYRQNRLLAAESMYQEAATINFGYEEIYLNYGTTELLLGHLNDARTSFEKALAINPNSPVARDNLAQLKSKPIIP